MTSYEVRLLRHKRVAEDTMAFYFSKPAGYTYRAGQSARVALIDPPETDRKGNSRTFNLASAPDDAELMIATRLRGSTFKHMLQTAPAGTVCSIGEASGTLVLHKKDPSRPAVFLAGGIGITPFLSILRHAAHAALPHPIYLFYSNRRPELAAFMPELQAVQQSNTNCHVIATMTAADGSTEWSGERGRIGRELLERHLPDLAAPMYYLAGPPAMTTAMLDMLQDNGVPDDAIKSADFYGY